MIGGCLIRRWHCRGVAVKKFDEWGWARSIWKKVSVVTFFTRASSAIGGFRRTPSLMTNSFYLNGNLT